MKRPGNKPTPTTSGFVEVHIDSLQLQVGVAMVSACGVDAVLIANHLRGR